MGGGVFPPCVWPEIKLWWQVMKITVTSFKRSCAPNPAADHHRPRPLPETPGHSQASLGQPLVVSLLLSPGSWYPQGFVYALQASVFSVLCKFLGLYGGVNGNLLQEGLCHTQVCCTQRPCPCGMPLLTCTSTRDIHTLKIMSSVKCKLNYEITPRNQ